MAEPEVQSIDEIVGGVNNSRVGKDVVEMCTILKVIVEGMRTNHPSLPKEFKDTLTNHFQDIYWSLKLHMVFHEVVHKTVDFESSEPTKSSKPGKPDKPPLDPHEELRKLGVSIDLTDEELGKQPDHTSALNYCVDPWSKLIEIFSAITETEESLRGSEGHAKKVMCIAKDFLKTRSSKENETQREDTQERTLTSKNIFRPKALAMVSRNGKYFVGSSIAVSHFLRPLYLHKRIVNFKQSLKKAIIFYQPLESDTADKTIWSSSAFATGNQWNPKPPCQNCAWMFRNLEGFIVNQDHSINSIGDSFLGACAEYCPVNQLLADDVETSLSENDAQFMDDLQKRNRDRCLVLFKEFGEIAKKCIDACNSGDKRKKQLFREIRHQVHIFGLKPECNHHF